MTNDRTALRAKIAAVDAMPFSAAWKTANEELGFATVRALPALLDQLDTLEARLKIAEDALQAIVDNYATDMSHVDYRVRACHEANDALAAIADHIPDVSNMVDSIGAACVTAADRDAMVKLAGMGGG